MRNQNKYNFLFLTDLSDSSYQSLDYLINLSKRVNGSVELYCIYDLSFPSKSLNTKSNTTETNNTSIKKQFNSLRKTIDCKNFTKKKHNSFEAIKKMLLAKIEKSSEIIVVSKNIKILFKDLVHLLLKKIEHNVLLLDYNNNLLNGNSVVIGCDDTLNDNINTSLSLSIAKSCSKPLIVLYQKKDESIKLDSLKKSKGNIFYKFIPNSKIVECFKEFVNNNNIELICLNRKESNQSFFKKIFNTYNPISDTVKSINSSILIMKQH